MTNRTIIALIALAVAIFLVTQTFYTVDPTKQVLVRQFGAIVGEPKTDPGLYAKVPLVQDIQRIDRRLLDSLINSEIRGVLSSVPLHAVLTDQRANLMDEITRRVNAKTKELGVETVDVRIKRADLPQANSQSVYNRMKTDREREAGQLRAEGDEEKARITATADREVAVIKADAGLKAQVTKGEADAEATRIYAQAFNKDKDFYAFYRRMEAYKQAFGAGGSTMILSPDTDFFRYFNDPAGPPAAKK